MGKQIRILELIYWFQIGGKGGGIGRFGIELGRAIDRNKFDISLCGLFNSGSALEEQWLENLNAEGIPAFCASKLNERHPYLGFWSSIRFLWKWQSRYKADLIHSHSEFSDVAALLLFFHPTHPKILRTVHYGYQHEWRKRPLRRLLLTNLLFPLLFKKEIGVSQAITENLNQRPLCKLLKRRARCVYNAIDLNRFRPTSMDRSSKKMSLNVPLNVPLVGNVGRLTEQKGQIYLLEAMALILAQNIKAHFLIVGDGELADPLKKRAQDLGISDRVLFTGSRTDVEEILACMDLFVSASLWEGLPTAIMESMASGIPIVATDIPGTRDLIQDRQNGWLVPPGDAEALARTILSALEEAKSRREFADRAQRDVQQFSIKSIASKYEEIYLSI